MRKCGCDLGAGRAAYTRKPKYKTVTDVCGSKASSIETGKLGTRIYVEQFKGGKLQSRRYFPTKAAATRYFKLTCKSIFG